MRWVPASRILRSLDVFDWFRGGIFHTTQSQNSLDASPNGPASEECLTERPLRYTLKPMYVAGPGWRSFARELPEPSPTKARKRLGVALFALYLGEVPPAIGANFLTVSFLVGRVP